MPRYQFRISGGIHAGTCGEGFDLADGNAAWTELTWVCGDLVGGVVRNLEPNSEWYLELLDESRTPLFRIRVASETLQGVAAAQASPNHPASEPSRL